MSKREETISKASGLDGVNTVYLKPIEKKIFAFGDKDNQKAYIALKYYDKNYECFSRWTKNELKAFSRFAEKIAKHSWNQIEGQGGKKGSKTGFGCTKHKDNSVINSHTNMLENISEDITAIELRVNEKARVHGFRLKSVFFLVLLDRKHRIYPE